MIAETFGTLIFVLYRGFATTHPNKVYVFISCRIASMFTLILECASNWLT